MSTENHAFPALYQFVSDFLEFSQLLFVLLIIVGVLIVIYMYLADITQTKQAIRRNYPVVGRFRYLFEHMGEFFRQYFFALDRDELPFNRAQRAWVYRAAKKVDSTIAFGSTRPLNQPGDIIFLNCLFPTLTEDAAPNRPITIGEGYARLPYTTSSLFHISGMSFGAISVPAVRALAHGAQKAGIWMNTGEGSVSPYHLEGGCDLVFQIGTAKYGVGNIDTTLNDDKLKKIAELDNVKMFEIKMSQGAKPGKGGILPKEKITQVIASVRDIPQGQDSISPNGHREIRSIDDLLDMLKRVRDLSGKPVGFKTVIGSSDWIEELMQAIHKRGLEYAPDFITIDSADGGTGAAPQSLMDYVGLPIKRSLPLMVDKLIEYDLKQRIKVIVSGKLVNPSEVAWAISMGADFVTSARGFMFALGCIQALQCNKNTCPTGITTHNKDLQRGLDPIDKAERVYNYAMQLQYEVGTIAHACGVKEARGLTRKHAHIINGDGMPEPMEEQFPTPTIRADLIAVSKNQ